MKSILIPTPRYHPLINILTLIVLTIVVYVPTFIVLLGIVVMVYIRGWLRSCVNKSKLLLRALWELK